MQIQVLKKVLYSRNGVDEHALMPGIYQVPSQVSKAVADYAIATRQAIVCTSAPMLNKIAPENKLARIGENKHAKRKGYRGL